MGIFEVVFTKSALKKALKRNQIKVNGKLATSATFIVGGEIIELTWSEEIIPFKKQLNLSLKILFEDEYLALIQKPPGILVSGNSFKTIQNALSQNLQISNLPDASTPKPVHRLDFATTGILLIGKTNSSIRLLNKLFEKQEVHKIYYAITIGEMNSEGEISSDIDGKEAKTIYKVLESVSSERFNRLNLVELIPQTGRRHQLRKHLSEIGNPILGDREYGKENLILLGKGMYLHAYSLEFIHPITKEEIHVKCELPERFRKIFNEF